MTIEEKQIHNAVHVKLQEFDEFVSLVRRMREAQVDFEISTLRVTYKREQRIKLSHEDYNDLRLATNKVVALEDKVDEYLKKMEDED